MSSLLWTGEVGHAAVVGILKIVVSGFTIYDLRFTFYVLRRSQKTKEKGLRIIEKNLKGKEKLETKVVNLTIYVLGFSFWCQLQRNPLHILSIFTRHNSPMMEGLDGISTVDNRSITYQGISTIMKAYWCCLVW